MTIPSEKTSRPLHRFAGALLVAGLAASFGAAADTIALRHARVIDGSGGAPHENSTILIEDGRIAAVGPDAQVRRPAGTREVDLSGRSILPGMISNHSHLGMTDGAGAGPQNYNRGNIERQLRQFQRYGVTTVTSLGLNGPLFQQLRAEARAGIGVGADLFGADRGIGVPEGAPPMNVAPDQLYRPTSVEEARVAVREMAARKPDLIKIWVDDFNHTLAYKMKPEIYTAVIDESHKHGLRVAAHVYYLDDAKKLIAAGAGILAHGVRDLPVDDELIAAIKAKDAWYISTLDLDEAFYIFAAQPEWTRTPFFRQALQPALAAQLDDPAWQRQTLADPKKLAIWEQGVKTNQANLKRLVESGAKVGFGTDSGATPLRIPGFAEHRELQLAVDAGLTPLQAITLATGNAAALLGLDDRGVIAPGKRADLLVVAGDPSHEIADSEKIEAVWQQGREVSGPVVP
ncbi:metal-dependent hydrolase family protein [Azotobacter chroococcum]|uniref:Amidohydrolase family protein n=1 Tax=Azotobacter chroococcum TaxID=353 RepID=A0AAP9YH12_9GAMM|nr:amidohydrolase family protein [Azotobacter chroococcum]QQE91160.1 amidohydrolase family protein [Azotobacter chroococcum]TKD33156.1 amidohydrolase family protein [Azotobacter chroococcum]